MTSGHARKTGPMGDMPDEAVGALCVLASGSRGNCSVLVVPDGGTRRVVLIDAGLSPRRTAALLCQLGIELWEIDSILLTHLDADHAHASWLRHRRVQAPVYMHATHRGHAQRIGLWCDRVETFTEPFCLFDRVRVHPRLLHHDQLGVVVYRFEIADATGQRCCRLGFATDVGRPSPALIEHVSSCDVLGIESNYCPKMQMASTRPDFLKRRIMGGSGHLSNHECLDVLRQAAPRQHVVFLHLSQECNDPALVRSLHEGSAYQATLSNQHRPTPWIWLTPSGHSVRAGPVAAPFGDLPLWTGGQT
ncbi:MAG: MBL fold metallo-hydrolase [Phycisphaerales bacterium]|nr:MBL fold metallo-hydrolase [Phycisphaerales bacterium]